jgi:hypothetical protein
VDGSGTVSKEEFLAFVKAALTQDKIYILKLVFRSFDQNRNGTLETAEIKEVAHYVGLELEDQEIEDKIREVAGESSTGLTFKQIASVLFGIDVADADADPYEGKGPKVEAAPAAPEAGAGDTPDAATAGSGDAAAKSEDKKKSGCCLLL